MLQHIYIFSLQPKTNTILMTWPKKKTKITILTSKQRPLTCNIN